MPTLTSLPKVIWRATRERRANGARRSKSSARKTTAVNVRRVNAVAVRFDEREMRRERAIVTISFIHVI